MSHQKHSTYAGRNAEDIPLDAELEAEKSHRYLLRETRTNVYKALNSLPGKLHKKATETRMSLHYTLTSMTQLVKQANRQQFQKAREKKHFKNMILLTLAIFLLIGICGFIIYLLCNCFAFCSK